MLRNTVIGTPVGELLVTARGGGALESVRFGGADGPRPGDDETLIEVTRQIREYFAGTRTTFDLDVAPRGTEFQRRVWDALDAIPYGTTTTYGAVAAAVGAPRDRIRAVAAAIGANPLLIIRPCHRVVGADGSLTGYAGGTERKLALLTLEGARRPQLA